MGQPCLSIRSLVEMFSLILAVLVQGGGVVWQHFFDVGLFLFLTVLLPASLSSLR